MIGVEKMNPYVSANEKAQLIRIILMKKVLEDAIDIYAGLDSTDKAFLGELRHGRTRIEKAVKLRRLALDNDADDKLLAGAAKLEPMFLARPEARKAHKEIVELQSTLPMDIEDLQDWYGFTIEFTCKNCTKGDYTDCPARRVLTKYEICPIDPGAKDKCQYSYAEDTSVVEPKVPGIIEKPEFAELGSVSFREHYAVKRQVEELQEKLDLAEKRFDFQTEECLELVKENCLLEEQLAEYDRLKMVINDILHPNGNGPVNPSMCDIVAYIRGDFSVFRGQISDLQTRCDELSKQSNDPVVEIKQIEEDQHADDCADYNDKEIITDEDSLPVFLGLNNGNKLEMLLPESMANKLIEDIQRPRLSRSICARFINGEFVAIDLQEVVATRVSGLVDADWVKHQPIAPSYEFTTEQELYHVECKCGTEYFAAMNAGRTKANCRDCKYTVFADRSADKIISPTGGAEATLLTNRYFVTNEPRIPQQYIQEKVPVHSNHNLSNSRELKPVAELRDIKNVGRGYKDPCQLFG